MSWFAWLILLVIVLCVCGTARDMHERYCEHRERLGELRKWELDLQDEEGHHL